MMSVKGLIASAIGIALGPIQAHSATALATAFHAGVAQAEITPAIGTPLAGNFSTRVSTGVLEPIFAKAIVVEQGGQKAAFIALDLCYTTRPLVLTVRRLVEQQTGIAAGRVMISATHTHTGPVLERQSLMDELTGAHAPLAIEFMKELPGLIVRAVVEADAKLKPAEASAAMGREEHLSFNRRYLMSDGSVGWQPQGVGGQIVRALGPIDPDVGVWLLTTREPQPVPVAAYVNFAMHPTNIGGLNYSPDFPGALGRRLADYFGPDMMTFFANGCSGNIGPKNPLWDGQQHGPHEAERVGTVLAAAVFRTLPNLSPLDTRAPRGAARMIRLPPRQHSAEEVEAARGIAGQRPRQPGIVEAARVLDVAERNGAPFEVEVQVIALSDDFAVVSLPGEIFVELGLAIKRSSPFKYTFIAELANGSIGYIPNRAAYAQGKYEVVSARCAEGSGEILVESAIELLNEVAAP